MLHADPLKSCDQTGAARRTQQVDDLFGAFLGRTEDEAVLEQVLELRLRRRIADDLSKEPPIAENLVAFRNCRTGIADGRAPVRRHHNISKHREVDRSRLAEGLEGRREYLGLRDDHRRLEMRGCNPGVPELGLRDAGNSPYSTLEASAEPHRRAWLARHSQRERKLRCLEMPPLERHILFCEQALDERYAFNEAAGPAAVIEAHDIEFVLGPARRDADNGASAADRIEECELLGDMQWFVERQDEHAGAEGHALSVGGQSHERLDRREPSSGAVRQMVADGDAVKADTAGEANLFGMLGEPLGHRV